MTKIRSTPQSVREDLDLTLFLEEVRTRTSPAESAKLGTVFQSAILADSTAATVADLKADFNTLLANLRAAGIQDE